MSASVIRQPNGKLCRYSYIVDDITDYNMTDEEYIEMCAEKGRREAREVLKKHLYPYDTLKRKLLDEDRYVDKNDLEKYKKLFAEMEV